MATATRPPLEVRNYGGVKQLSVTTEHDLARIDQVDPARWAATSAPLRDLHCDARFLDYLDTHSKGRIRVSELVQARDWAFERLSSRAALIARSDVLTLADLDVSKDPGKRIRQTADHVLAELKSATRDKITLAEATRLAHYLNAIVANQIRAYLLAVYLNAVNASVPNQANWDRVAACESGGNWHLSTGNGYYGGLQFSASTWRAVGGTGYPHQHSREEQIRRANILKDRAGLGQWPRCGSRFYG